MLTLSRKLRESIIIGTDIAVFVCDTRSDRVRLGIRAPITTEVHRHEIFREKHGLDPAVDDPVQLLALYAAVRSGQPLPALTDGREIGRRNGAR